MPYAQNGYSVLNNLAETKTYFIEGTNGVSIPLRNDVTGQIIALFAADYHATVEPLNRTDCHGFNRRRISGTSEWSNHAAGNAVDLNATKHPYGGVGTYTKKQQDAINKLLVKYEGVIRAGMNYRGTKDEMHYEVDAEPARVKEVYNKLTKPTKPVVKKRGRISLKNAIKAAETGSGWPDAARKIQKALVEDGYGSFSATGYYGVLTTAAYAAFQRSLGYRGADADGIPGKKSLEKLGFEVKP